MENGFAQENRVPSHEQGKTSSKVGIDSLPERLCFVETDELTSLRTRAVDLALSDNTEAAAATVLEYQLQAEGVVYTLQGIDYMHGQIGQIVSMATLHRDTGNTEAFLNDIEDAKLYAENIQEDEVLAILEQAPSIEIARLLSCIGEEYGFDNETVAEIEASPYGQAFEIAYGYLTQAGIDADEVLAPFFQSIEGNSEDS